jgi:hypothetical protein
MRKKKIRMKAGDSGGNYTPVKIKRAEEFSPALYFLFR